MLDIIILTLSHANAPFSSTIFSLAKEWAKTNRVFYIDHPFTVKDFVSHFKDKKFKQQQKALLYGKDIYSHIPDTPAQLRVVTPRLVLPINALPEGKTYEKLARINDQILYSTIKQIQTDFGVNKFIFLNSFDPFFGRYFPKSFNPLLYVYQSVDDISQEPYIARHGVRLENEVIAQHATLTLTTSQSLLQSKSHISPHTHLLPNAADVALFKKALSQALPRPPELQNIHNKVIIYTGVISELRFDYTLLQYIARQHADKTILLVGPYHEHEIKQHHLDELPNVILTGAKPIEQLPAYLQHADCAIIPFLMNTLTKSIYPLKINEYLAAGKPVVTTPFSDDIIAFGKTVQMTTSPVQFSDYIEKAIYNDTPLAQLERLQTAENNSWTKRAQQFWQIVNPYLAQKGYAPAKQEKITTDCL
jgi:teichuronic acid biosynthesis glycosyltransferase TuaH